MTRFITTLGYSGLSPVAPGTVGSAVAIPLGVGVFWIGGWPGFLVALIALTALGVWAIGIETEGRADPDLSEIVIDELSGQWITLIPAFALGLATSLPALILAFLLFRAFDITKPPPISWADRIKTPVGVMGDDILAGVAGALVFWLIAPVIPGLPT